MAQRRDSETLARLGELEADVMNIVWVKGEATVQDVKDALEPTQPLAYTTVMTVMSRLAEKGILNRRKEGRAYLYTPADSQEKVAGSLLRSLVRRLYDGAAATAIAHLLESEAELDEAELDRLEDLIRARREAQQE